MSADTALVIIDTQIGVVQDAYKRDEILENINVLLERARSSAIPVIYVQHDGPEGDDLAPGASGWPIHPAVAPREGEPIVRKESPDSFHLTNLQEELQKRGIKNLVIAGGQTEVCVDTTIRRSLSEGYDVVLAGDAHATFDNDTLTAEQIIAFTNSNLRGLWAAGQRVKVKLASEISFTEFSHAS